jgi:hypothetical protein
LNKDNLARVVIYTNYEGDDVDLGGDDDDCDVDVDVDDDEDTSPHTKGMSLKMKVSNSPRRRPWSSRIRPLSEKKRTFASSAALENSIKIRA